MTPTADTELLDTIIVRRRGPNPLGAAAGVLQDLIGFLPEDLEEYLPKGLLKKLDIGGVFEVYQARLLEAAGAAIRQVNSKAAGGKGAVGATCVMAWEGKGRARGTPVTHS